MSFLLGVCFIISKCMRTMSGWVFIIDKRCPDPRLMSGQIQLRNSTFYFYDLQKIGLSSSKAARWKVGRLCGKSRSQRYVFYVETDTYTLSFALCLHHSQILNFNVGMKCLCSRAAHGIPETMKHGEKVVVHSSSYSYSLHLQQTYVLL